MFLLLIVNAHGAIFLLSSVRQTKKGVNVVAVNKNERVVAPLQPFKTVAVKLVDEDEEDGKSIVSEKKVHDEEKKELWEIEGETEEVHRTKITWGIYLVSVQEGFDRPELTCITAIDVALHNCCTIVDCQDCRHVVLCHEHEFDHEKWVAVRILLDRSHLDQYGRFTDINGLVDDQNTGQSKET